MESNHLKIILATEEHLLSGNIATQGQRLLDVLDDVNTDFVRMTDVQVLRRARLHCAAHVPDAIVRKAGIGFAALASAEHEAPQKRLHAYVSKKRFDALLLVMGYEIRGTLHLKGTGDPLLTLCHELTGFFPVAQASLSFEGIQVGRQKAQVIIANKNFVSLFHMAESPAQEGLSRDRLSPAAGATLPPEDWPASGSTVGFAAE